MNLLLVNWQKDQADYLKTNLSPLNHHVYEADSHRELRNVISRSQPMALILFNTDNWLGNDKLNTFRQFKTRWPRAHVHVFGDRLNFWQAFKFTLGQATNCQVLPKNQEKLLKQVRKELSRLRKIDHKVRALRKLLNQPETMDILIMASMLEARGDENTVNHLYRVQAYTHILASTMTQMPKYKKIITPKYIRTLVRASILHDIGKINIPFDILSKRDKLTDQEQRIIQDHCVFGEKVLDLAMDKIGASADFEMAVQIALNHHERYDGSGYPNGLSGESIPLEALIVALADVYDALTSPRAYRNQSSFSHNQACETILEREKDKFDPDVLEAFRKNQLKFDDIRIQHDDMEEQTADTTLKKRRAKATLAGQMPGDFIDLVTKYSGLIEQAKSGIVIEQKGICKFANQAMSEISGYPVEEIEGMSFLDMVTPEYRDSFISKDKTPAADGKSLSMFETKIRDKAGLSKHIEIFVRDIRYYGKPARMKIIRDLSQLKQLEEERRKLSSAVQQSMNGIAIGDLELKIRYMNHAFAQMHGYSREEMLGMKFADLHNDEQMKEYQKALKQTRTQSFWSGKIDQVKKDGTSFPVYMSITLLKDEREKPNGILVICRDRSESKKKDELLKESEKKYHLLFEASPVGIGLTNFKGNIFDVNQSMQELTGYTREELKGTKLADTYVDPNERRRLIKTLKKSGRVRDREVRLKRKDGTIYYALLNVDKIEMGGQEVLLTTARDISERKQKEEEIKKTYAELKKAQNDLIQSEKLATLGVFSSGIAHEIKNPLSIILSGAEFLETKLSDADTDTQTALAKVKESVLKADYVIKNTLKYATPSDLKLERTKPDDLINDTLSLLKYRITLKNITVKTELDPNGLYIQVDKNQMQQVLFNLLINATEAMPKGGQIKIKTYKTEPDESDPEPPVCVIEISDTGEGIARKHLPKIFEPFFTTKRARQGTGLGLPIAKMIIENHGGTLVITSASGKGTTAKITLPLV